MSKIAYLPRDFNPMQSAVIDQAEQICDQYAAQGYNLTLRQLYYRFIATDTLPESRRDPESGTKNTERNYKWLGELVSSGRLAGRIDWSHIEDRTRGGQGGDAGWDDPAHGVSDIAEQYGITHWDDQDHYLEVWVEKEALADVVSRPAGRWSVLYLACKGYLSQSEMHEAALRLRREERSGRSCHVIYLGDHDPSGIDMSRDIQDRLVTFRCGAEVRRIALNMDQVEQYDPPPSPAKITDSRAGDYIERFGTDSWELDALPPDVLDALVEESITRYLNRDLWDIRIRREAAEREVLLALAGNWGEVEEFLRDGGYLNGHAP